MTQTMTPVAMNTAPRRWKRLPSDGTSYAYCKSDDGCVVETKPRFRSAIDYTLSVPPAVTGLDRFLYASFRTVREAQDAVCIFQSKPPPCWRRVKTDHQRGVLPVQI